LNDSYAVERLLGEGGMGRVYLARHTRIAHKRVAVKVLHPEFAKNDQVLARFQREAEAAAAISHPNVVSVLDIDVTPRGMPYLVCEYLEGVDLSDHLREVKRLDVLDALSVTRQLCRGLYAAQRLFGG
jgi:serine/threonine-protein kinase